MNRISNQSLACLGGPAVIQAPLAPFRSIGEEEVEVAADVVRTGVLSAYIGGRGPAFMGGEQVRAFEGKAAGYFGVAHAIAVNSWTSGLIAAVGAIGIEPGDEIITTPWTMAATSTAILHFAGIPIFADIDRESFNIDPASVESVIGPRTRAILAVDIFGQSADMRALRAIADRHGLKLITDTAQAPGAMYFGEKTGTLADIGGYSLSYHKHIHCGEGGIIVTNDDRLADRLRLIRNHGEAVIDSELPEDLCNILGYNFRMGEIEAAIAASQLDKLEERVGSRQRAAAQLNEGLKDLPGVKIPVVSEGCTHVYYVYALTIDTELLGVPRSRIVEALRAEGVPGLAEGYANLHLLPMFRRRIAYGTGGFPWTSPYAGRDVHYGPGLCPVAEELHARSLILFNICLFEFPPEDVDLIVLAFRKVWDNLDKLRDGQ
ncbi:MAG: DegT/DnrJ/EryC1/StrS family aminotransferase [Allosphingosinicella sp.]